MFSEYAETRPANLRSVHGGPAVFPRRISNYKLLWVNGAYGPGLFLASVDAWITLPLSPVIDTNDMRITSGTTGQADDMRHVHTTGISYLTAPRWSNCLQDQHAVEERDWNLLRFACGIDSGKYWGILYWAGDKGSILSRWEEFRIEHGERSSILNRWEEFNIEQVRRAPYWAGEMSSVLNRWEGFHI